MQITPDPVAPVLRRVFPVIAGPKSGLAVAGVVRCTSSVFRVRAVQLLATLGERESDHLLSRIQVVSHVATDWGRVKGSPGTRQGPELARGGNVSNSRALRGGWPLTEAALMAVGRPCRSSLPPWRCAGLIPIRGGNRPVDLP